MRPTRAGIGLAVTVLACAAAGRVLGLMEMFVLAAMGGAALVLAAIYTATVRLDLAVGRSASPSRLRAGAPARIDLALQNKARRRTPVLAAHDTIQNSRGASLMLAPIRPGGLARIAYRLPTSRRGLIKVGPLDLTIGDPLGLSSAKLRAAEVTNLMVHPQLIELRPLVAIAGHDPTAEQQPLRALASSGDEFFALRPYVMGDELKRVNWRATARLDELVVRQDERPNTGRVTVILDRRREVYDEDGFERAVSAALSALHSGFRGGDALRFLTSAAPAVTDIRTRSELDAVDEQLALIATTSSASLVRSLEDQSRTARGGTLVVVTGMIAEHLEAAVARAKRKFGLVIVITCQRPIEPTPSWAICHDGHTDLPAAWYQALTGNAPAHGGHSGHPGLSNQSVGNHSGHGNRSNHGAPNGPGKLPPGSGGPGPGTAVTRR